MKRYDEKEKRSLVRIGLFFALLAISIITEGYFSYRDYAVHFRTHVKEQLTSINKLKATELAEQLDEYLSDAEILRLNRDFAAHVGSYFEDPQNGEFRQIQAWLQNYQSNGEYENVVLLDIKGTVRISDNESIPPVSPEVKAYISKAVTTKQVEFVDFYKSETDQSARLAILIPIMNMQSEDQVSGLVLMVINPNIYLYPYIEQSPVPGKTGESVLIRREGDEFLLLNTPRLSADNPLTIRRKLTNATVLKTAIEQNGFAEGADYRGESVVAVVQAVAGSPWILVTKLDTIEAYAPVRGYLQQTIIVCIALISIIGTALALVWRGQRLRYYHQQFELAEALSQSEQNMRNFFNTVDHMLFVLDDHGDILLVNDTVSRTLGYSAEELKGQNVLMLHPPERREEAGRIVGEMLAGTADYCPVPLLKKNGQYIPVETRVVKGQWSGQDVIFGVTKDISEIQASEEKFSKVFRASPAPMAITDTATGRYMDVNEIFLKTLGYSREDVIGKTANELNLFVDADQRTVLLERMNIQGYLRDEDVLVRAKSGDLRNGVFSAEYIKLQNQDLLLTVMNDITERKQAEAALQKSEAVYRQAIEVSGAVPYLQAYTNIGEGIDYSFIGEGIRQITGYGPEEFNGKLWDSLVEEIVLLDDLAGYSIHEAIQRVRSGKNSIWKCEHRIRARNGETRWVFEAAVELRGANEISYGSIGLYQDITERKQTELALRNSEEKYRGLMESLDSVVATTDFEGRYLYMNDIAASQLGGKPDDFIGKTMHELLPALIADTQLKAIQQVFRQNKEMVDETISFVNGKPRWYRTMVQPIHNENGQVAYALINATDIHDLKTAQHDLQELNRTLEERVEQRAAEVQDLYDNAPNGYHSLDANGAFILINQTELNRLGYARRDIVGVKKFRDLLTPQSQLIFDRIFPEFKIEGTIADLTLELIRKDGSVFPVLLNASIMRDEHNKFLMSRSTTIDITERVKVENALLESRDELSAANAALEKAARMKDEFLASMSHELRTPLTGVLGLSEALQLKAYGDLNEKQLNTLKTIEESGRHLLDLINDILDLSKIEAGRLELQFGPTYMEDICQASLQLIKGMAQQKHQQIHYSPAAEVTIGYADARRIKQILVNLLSNAVKFTPNGGELGLEVEHSIPEQKLKFSVWDKGIGIKPEDMHKLFKPFTQIDSSLAREYNGTGLGLSLAHRLVELHNGGIEVESAPGKGSRFTVTLPWSPQDTTNMKIPEPRRQSAIQQTVDSAPPTILIADDNETVLELLTDFLEMKQYRVIKVRSGVELLAKITEVLPSLMLVDIQMPGMDGLETIRRIRSHSNPAIAATPVIAVTALAMPGDRDLCMSAGANEYMSKPLKLLELADIVEKWKRS